jgi:iron complex outermembrane receptor protein
MLLGASGLAGPAEAQEAVTLSPIDVSGAGSGTPSSAGFVAKRTRAGTKTETPIIEVPQSISVITRAEMDARNVQREGEAFRYTSGVYSEPYGGDPRATFDAPIIRGFDVSTTGVYRDGLREANGVWSRFITEFYGLERVDVLKGPSSVLYGQGSPGGIIDKITKKPTQEARGEANIQGGTFSRIQGAADISGPIFKDQPVFYRLVTLARDSDTQFRYNSDAAVPDIRQYVAPSLTWEPGPNTILTIQGDWLHNRTAGPFTVTLANQVPTNILLGDPSFNKSDFTQATVGYRLEHRFDEVFAVRQNLRYGSLDFDYNNMTATTISPAGVISRAATGINEQLYSLALDTNLQARLQTGPVSHLGLIGSDYQRAIYTTRTRQGLGPTLNIYNPTYGQPVTIPTTVSSYSHQTASQLGFYAQDQAKFDRFVFTVGARVDNARSDTTNYLTRVESWKNDTQVSYRAGINYVFDSGLAPYFGYSRSFLPTTGTDFFGTPFRPTIAEQYEGGIKYQPTSFNGLFTIAYFDLTQQNVLTPDPARPLTTFRVQTGEVNSRGLEMEARTSPIPGLNLVAAFTHNPVYVTKDNVNAAGVSTVGRRPIYIAKDLASLWGEYTLQEGPLTGFGLGAGVRFVGPTYADPNNTILNRAFTLADAALYYDLGRASATLTGFRFQLNVSNVFNHRFVICTATTNCQWGSARTVIAGLTYRW